jgi:hypothetical protein
MLNPELRDTYNYWNEINNIRLIVSAKHLYDYKNLIDKFIEYNKNDLSKVMIFIKIKIFNNILLYRN